MSDSTLLIPTNEERRREAMKTRHKITVLTIIQILAYPAGFASTIPFLGQEGILIIILPLFLFLFVPFIVIKILGRIKSKLWAKINDTIYDEVTYPAMASAFSLREDTRNENFQTEDILSSGLLDFTWNDYTCGFFIRGESGGFPVSYARICFSYISHTIGSDGESETITDIRYNGMWLTCTFDKPFIVNLRIKPISKPTEKRRKKVPAEPQLPKTFEEAYLVEIDSPIDPATIFTP